MYTECSRETRQGGKNQKQVHVWAVIGQNFKSDITFYNVPGNINGKITLQVQHFRAHCQALDFTSSK